MSNDQRKMRGPMGGPMGGIRAGGEKAKEDYEIFNVLFKAL